MNCLNYFSPRHEFVIYYYARFKQASKTARAEKTFFPPPTVDFFENSLQYPHFYYILFFCTINRRKEETLVNEKKKATLLALLRAAVAMAIFVLAVVNYEKLRNIDVRAIVDSSASIAVAVGAILGIYFIKSVLFIIPASLIYISVGMAFTPWQAILINLCGIVIEVTATYLLGVFLGGDYVTRLLQKNKAGQKILEKKFNDNFPVLLGIRALPVFPIDFVSLFWGASKCGFFRYFAASVVGIMPRVILFTILGDGIYDYIPIHLIVKIIICAIPVGVAAYLIRHFIRQKKSGAAESGPENSSDGTKEMEKEG